MRIQNIYYPFAAYTRGAITGTEYAAYLAWYEAGIRPVLNTPIPCVLRSTA